MNRNYIDQYLKETITIVETVSREEIEKGVEILKETRENGGRLFILGVGGSAANASHAVNDFRKIGGIETYAPTDNVSELTARTNDEGWETTFTEWLKVSRLKATDTLMVFSVGGGSETTSLNIVNALKLGKERGAKVISIVSRDGGYSKQVSDACVLIPVVSKERITPHAEGWQGVIWHLLVNALNE
ncbi:MAG: SIS domain-containing protein [Lachnospiraceae bacterium]